MPIFLSDNRPSYRTVLDHSRKSVRRGRITSVRDSCGKAWRRMKEMPLTDAQRAELDQRIARYEQNPSDVIPWEQIKAGLFKKP